MRSSWMLLLVVTACNPPPQSAPPRAMPPPQQYPPEMATAVPINTLPSEPSPIDESREAKGHLSVAAIQRVVRANMSRMTSCYEAALARNQNAPGGKVRARLVIGRDGLVRSAVNQLSPADSRTTLSAGSEGNEPMLADSAVVACVIGEFRKLVFPAPSPAGIVVVTYPLIFSSQ